METGNKPKTDFVPDRTLEQSKKDYEEFKDDFFSQLNEYQAGESGTTEDTGNSGQETADATGGEETSDGEDTSKGEETSEKSEFAPT